MEICCHWNAKGTGKLTCPINSKLDVTKLNVVVKLVSVLQLIEIKHWKGILWLYSCTRNIVCRGAFFFFKALPKGLRRKARQGVNLSLGIIFWLTSNLGQLKVQVDRKEKFACFAGYKECNKNFLIKRANANHPTIKVYYWSIMMRNRKYILGHNGL